MFSLRYEKCLFIQWRFIYKRLIYLLTILTEKKLLLELYSPVIIIFPIYVFIAVIWANQILGLDGLLSVALAVAKVSTVSDVRI